MLTTVKGFSFFMLQPANNSSNLLLSFCFLSCQEIQSNLKLGNKRPDWISTPKKPMSLTYLVWTFENKSTIERFVFISSFTGSKRLQFFFVLHKWQKSLKTKFTARNMMSSSLSFLKHVRYLFAKISLNNKTLYFY